MKRIAARLRTASVAVGALALMALPALAQQAQNPGAAGPGQGPAGHVGPGVIWHHPFMQHMMAHHQMHHHHPGMMVVGVLMTLFALIGLCAVVVLVGRLIRNGGCHTHRSRASLDILEGRYARSEISHDEFVEKKRDLLSRR